VLLPPSRAAPLSVDAGVQSVVAVTPSFFFFFFWFSDGSGCGCRTVAACGDGHLKGDPTRFWVLTLYALFNVSQNMIWITYGTGTFQRSRSASRPNAQAAPPFHPSFISFSMFFFFLPFFLHFSFFLFLSFFQC
jgi:hypothetical protein